MYPTLLRPFEIPPILYGIRTPVSRTVVTVWTSLEDPVTTSLFNTSRLPLQKDS